MLVDILLDRRHLPARMPAELVIARADQLAWRLGLRGYDAVHLAAALTWHENMVEEVVFATYDRRLWWAADDSGLSPFPEEQP